MDTNISNRSLLNNKDDICLHCDDWRLRVRLSIQDTEDDALAFIEQDLYLPRYGYQPLCEIIFFRHEVDNKQINEDGFISHEHWPHLYRTYWSPACSDAPKTTNDEEDKIVCTLSRGVDFSECPEWVYFAASVKRCAAKESNETSTLLFCAALTEDEKKKKRKINVN